MSPIDKSTASKADNDPESIRALVASLGFEPVGDAGKTDSESTDSPGNGSGPSAKSGTGKPSGTTERILGNGNDPASEKVSEDEIAPMAKKPPADSSNGNGHGSDNGNGSDNGSNSTNTSNRRKRRKRKSARNGGQAPAKSPSATAASVAELGLNEELASKSDSTTDPGDTRSDDSAPAAVKAKADDSAPTAGSVDAKTTDSVESKSADSATESAEAKVKDSSKQTTDAGTDDGDTATMDIAGDAATTASDGSKRVHESSKGDNGTVSAAEQEAGTDPDNSVSGKGIAVEKGTVDDFDYTGDDTVVVDNKAASGTVADGPAGGVKIVSEKSFPASKPGSDSGDKQTGSKNGDKTDPSTEAKTGDAVEVAEVAKSTGASSKDLSNDSRGGGTTASGAKSDRNGAPDRDQGNQAKGDTSPGPDKASTSTPDPSAGSADKSKPDSKTGVEAKTTGDKSTRTDSSDNPDSSDKPDKKDAATDSSKDDDEASGDKSKKTETTRKTGETTSVDGSATKGGAAPLDDILDDVKVDSPVRASSPASEDLINLDSPEFSSIAGTPSSAPQPTGDVPKVRVDNSAPAPAAAPAIPAADTAVETKPAPTSAPAFDPESMPTGVVVPVVSKAGVKPTGWVEYFGTPFDPTTQLQARKVRRVVRHIDPWSVLTFSVLFHMCVFAALLLASVLVWNVADAAGTIENLENFILELGDFKTFTIDGQQVFRAGVAIAGILTLASSVLMVLMTVVFNLLSDLIGGIRVTVVEEETVRLRKLEN